MTIYICTPIHRIVPWFDKVIESIVNQTFENWVWSLVDNTEGFVVEKYINEWFYKNPNKSILRNKIVINCIKLSTLNIGKYKNISVKLSGACDNDICVELDCDDILSVNVCKYLYEADKKYPMCNVFFGGQCTVNENFEPTLYSSDGVNKIIFKSNDYQQFEFEHEPFVSSDNLIFWKSHLRAAKKFVFDKVGYFYEFDNSLGEDLLFSEFIKIGNPCVIKELCYFYIKQYNNTMCDVFEFTIQNDIWQYLVDKFNEINSNLSTDNSVLIKVYNPNKL